MRKRVFLVVLDGLGIGAMPDADEYGDLGANTLQSIFLSEKLHMSALPSMGLYEIDGVRVGEKVKKPIASYARMAEQSVGKDTTTGHWELAGLVSHEPMPTFPQGFPDEVILPFQEMTGRGVLCNAPYSGTEAIRDFGEEHLETGALIVYTSADSVFQIAAHEKKVPLETLYTICRETRRMLTGPYAVGRVIARPFIGHDRNDFRRTANRHDFSLPPTGRTMLDVLQEAGLSTIGIGKIHDIFTGRGLTESIPTASNKEGEGSLLHLLAKDFTGLAFINLVEFDMLYGHRRDVDGYAAALSEFDSWLTEFISGMREDDCLIITADHGCDPGFTKTTDHTREYVPMLLFGSRFQAGVNLGTRASFADISATILDYFGIDEKLDGESFLPLVLENDLT